MTTLNELEKLAKAATTGPWEIEWYICKADSDDVKAKAATKVGDELWRVPTRIGPICVDENHWARYHIGTEFDDTNYLSAVSPQTILSMIELIRVQHAALLELSPCMYEECKQVQTETLDAAIAAYDKFEMGVKMKTWKVCFEAGEVKFYMEFKGDFNQVIDLAEKLARKLDVSFRYDIDEVTK